MDTKESLREQRQSSGRVGTLIGISFALGLSLGMVMAEGGTDNSLFGWALYLIAFGLGIIGVLATWWLLGYEVTRTKKQEG